MAGNNFANLPANATLPKGRWRIALACAASRIENETGDGPHPRPKNAIECAAYMFLKMCMSGDVAYVKELADRLDGKAAQSVALTDTDGNNLPFAKVVRQIIDPQQPQPDHPTLQ